MEPKNDNTVIVVPLERQIGDIHSTMTVVVPSIVNTIERLEQHVNMIYPGWKVSKI